MAKTKGEKIFEEALSKPVQFVEPDSTKKANESKTMDKETEKKSSVLSKATLFVSTIPFETTSEDLEAFFSEVGPIRSCFIVNNKESGKSSGCGYVQYALAADAERAVTQLKKIKYQGKRTLKIALAIKKSVLAERKECKVVNLKYLAGVPFDYEKKEEERKALELKLVQKRIKVIPDGPGKVPRSSLQKKIDNSVSVLLSELPAGLEKNVLYKKVRKFGTVEKLYYGDNDSTLEKGTAKVVYTSAKEAQKAFKGMNDHIYKGVKVFCKVIETITAASLAKKGRLIVRNLAFNCKKEQLVKVFEAFGAISECSVPKLPDGKARGFGFVQFDSVDDAAKAIERINGQKILNRPVAVDWALGKSQYDIIAAAEVAVESGEEDESLEDVEMDAASLNGDENAQLDLDENAPIIYEADDVEENDKESRISEVPVTKNSGPEDEGCNLFVRNLSFATTKESLKRTFEKWGALNYAVITMDKITSLSRGTGFISFQRLSDAERCLADYENALAVSQMAETPSVCTKSNYNEKDKKMQKSVLKPSIPLAAASETTPFMIDNRFISVTPTVSRQIAMKITHASTLTRRSKDKRHLYLMREGVIFAGSEAATALTPQEMERRTAQFANRKRLLATNPNLFISRTRLSIRGLNAKITDSQLRTESKESVMKFWDDVAAGVRQGMEQEVIDEEIEEGLALPGSNRKAWVQQAKIIKEIDRIDPITKKPKSKGYGFVEFTSHADALACLRYLNNNPNAFALPSNEAPNAKRPIVEFAIENRLVLKKRVDRNGSGDNSKTKAKDKKRKREDGDVPKPAKKLSPAPNTADTAASPDKEPKAEKRKDVKTFKERREVRNVKQEEKRWVKPLASLAPVVKTQNHRGQEGDLKRESAKKSKRDLKSAKKSHEDDQFQSMVTVFKKKLFSDVPEAVEKAKKWFD